MFARAAFRATARTASRRTYATSGQDFIAEREAIQHHAAGSAELWRKITYYVAVPSIALGYFNAKSMMDEHHAHVEHIKEENGGELPERVVYPYFNVRTKDFPWGDKTLFYNPHVNIAPEAAE